jgi:hypothetical protein
MRMSLRKRISTFGQVTVQNNTWKALESIEKRVTSDLSMDFNGDIGMLHTLIEIQTIRVKASTNFNG